MASINISTDTIKDACEKLLVDTARENSYHYTGGRRWRTREILRMVTWSSEEKISISFHDFSMLFKYLPEKP